MTNRINKQTLIFIQKLKGYVMIRVLFKNKKKNKNMVCFR